MDNCVLIPMHRHILKCSLNSLGRERGVCCLCLIHYGAAEPTLAFLFNSYSLHTMTQHFGRKSKRQLSAYPPLKGIMRDYSHGQKEQ